MSNSAKFVAIISTEMSLDSRLLAKKNSHIHGAIVAVPARDGESLCTAKSDNPPQTIAWQERRILAKFSSSAGISSVRIITIAIEPIQRTWSETACWWFNIAAVVIAALNTA